MKTQWPLARERNRVAHVKIVSIVNIVQKTVVPVACVSKSMWVLGLLFIFFTNACDIRTEPDCTAPPEAENEHDKNSYEVIGVKDGDTIVLLVDGERRVIRLAHIDCPEKRQAFGSKAKLFVMEHCFRSFIRLIHNNKTDRNRRLIAEVILKDGSNLNKELIKNGLAWHYKKYSRDTGYARLENIARQNKRGLWSDTKRIAPWAWRSKKIS